jgi:hypothetical protein
MVVRPAGVPASSRRRVTTIEWRETKRDPCVELDRVAPARLL